MNQSLYDQIKKSEEDRKRNKQKFIFTICLSNIVVALSVFHFQSISVIKIDTNTAKPITFIHHPHYKMVLLSLKNLTIPNKDANEIPVSLLSPSKEIIISKAFLHSKLQGTSDIESLDKYEVEVLEDELTKLSTSPNEILTAVPRIESIIISKKNMHQTKESKYEVFF